MSTQMLIRIEDELKNKLIKLARSEGKTASELIRHLINNYVNERDISAHIDDVWNRIGQKLKSNGVTSSAVEKAIKESRKNRQ